MKQILLKQFQDYDKENLHNWHWTRMTKEFNPRFLRRYMNLHDEIVNAISNFSNDIKSGDFPNENEQY